MFRHTCSRLPRRNRRNRHACIAHDVSGGKTVKGGAALRRARHRKVAAVPLDGPEPEIGALLLAIADAVKGFEEMRLVLGCDAAAGVAHRHVERSVGAARSPVPGAVGGKLDHEGARWLQLLGDRVDEIVQLP